jgi:hypothetical protein
MILTVGDQDYLEGNPIDFMVNGIKKTGTLKYNPGTFFTHEGWVIKSDKTYDFKNLPGFQLLNSRDKTPRMIDLETKKLERERQEQERGQRQAAEIARIKREYEEEQERNRQKAILDKERRVKESAERDKRYNIEMKEKKEKEEAEDALLNAQIETGIQTADTKIGDTVNYNGHAATVIGEYFEISYNGRNEIVKNDTFMNITAAQRKKDAVMVKRNPPRNINDGYQFSGGTRKRRKNRKTRYGLETRS